MDAGVEEARRFSVSWDQMHRDCRLLAAKLVGSGPFSAMVTITRGGLVPAAIVARELSIRIIETVSIHGYDETSRTDIRMLKSIAPNFAADDGARVLVIDDLVDTGRTARIMRRLMPKAHIATIYAKPLGRACVDSFVMEVAQQTWIDFPWDLGLTFQPPMTSPCS